MKCFTLPLHPAPQVVLPALHINAKDLLFGESVLHGDYWPRSVTPRPLLHCIFVTSCAPPLSPLHFCNMLRMYHTYLSKGGRVWGIGGA